MNRVLIKGRTFIREVNDFTIHCIKILVSEALGLIGG